MRKPTCQVAPALGQAGREEHAKAQPQRNQAAVTALHPEGPKPAASTL